MAVYLIMGKFTPQGIRNVKQTTARAHRFKEIAAGFGVKVLDTYWLMGEYDVVNIVEAKEEKSVSALLLQFGAWGNVITTTLRAHTKQEMEEMFESIDAVSGALCAEEQLKIESSQLID
jgi:uncharacterized protein with GYD domain